MSADLPPWSAQSIFSRARGVSCRSRTRPDARLGRRRFGFVRILSLLPAVSMISGAAFAFELRMLETTHPTEPDLIAYHVEDVLGRALEADGETDVSAALQRAIQDVFDAGGGTLYLPAGRYRLEQPVDLLAGVGLRGDFVRPDGRPVDPARNSILCAYYGRSLDVADRALLSLDGSSCIDGFVIWYPEQKPAPIVPYAPAIRHLDLKAQWAINTTSRNLFLVNPYHGIQLGAEEVYTCIQLMRHIYGTPLKTGIEVWKDADITRVVEARFSPAYWEQSGLPGAPAAPGEHRAFVFGQGSALKYRRCDGSLLANVTVDGYNKGMELANGHPLPNGFWLDSEGHYVNFRITNCRYAVWMNNIKGHGTQFFNSTLHGTESAVHVHDATHAVELAMFFKCTLAGGTAAVSQDWPGETNDRFSLMFTECTFSNRVDWSGGTLHVARSDFPFEGPHVRLGEGTARATVVDNTYRGKRAILNEAGAKAHIHDRPAPPSTAPDYTYRVDQVSAYKARKPRLYLATRHGAVADGRTDASAAIQSAIDAAYEDGGGYVVLPPGIYALEQPVRVRPGVELRGAFDFWHHSKFVSIFAKQGTPKGTLVMVRFGKDQVDRHAIVLEEDAGLNGICFHYPDQRYDRDTGSVTERYAWLVGLQGRGAYVKHVTAINPWRFVDVGDQANDVYIGYCNGAPLDRGIRMGEARGGMVDNVHFNSWYWNVAEFENQPSPFDEKDHFRKELDNWMKAHTHAFVFEGTRDLDLYGSFIFCTKQAFTLRPGKSTGRGPSGIIINSGNDWSKYGLYAHANDGLDLVNMHFIDVADHDPDPDLASIYLAPDMDDAIALYNVSTWGISPRFISMHGTDASRIRITNLSYYLYVKEQRNRLASGRLELVNAVRWIEDQPITFEFGPRARAEFYSLSLPFAHGTTPEGLRILEVDDGPMPEIDPDVQLIDIYTFP